MLCLLLGVSAAQGDRLLRFRAQAVRVGNHYAGEVWAGSEVVVRLRSASEAEALRRAQEVVERLTGLALAGLKPGELSVSQQGGGSLVARGQTIVTADAFTSRESRLSAQKLCESWRARLAAALTEPYLCVDPAGELLVPYAETRRIRFGGTVTGEATVSSMAGEIVQASLEGKGSVLVRGTGTGKTALSLAVGGLRDLIVVEVRKWAARIPGETVLRVRGAHADDELGQSAVANAALVGVVAEPGARVELAGVRRLGSAYQARVTAEGVGLLTAAREVTVNVTGGLPPLPRVARLFVSNYPEKVGQPQVLLRQALAPGTPVRVFWHHVNSCVEPLEFAVLVVNPGGAEATLRTMWAQSGPDRDEVFVGFRALERFWQVLETDRLVQMRVPAGAACRVAALTAGPQGIVSGVMHLVADEGDGLLVEVVARPARNGSQGLYPFSGIGSRDLTLSSYEFPAEMELAMSYAVGGPFAHATIGREALSNEDGFRLDGAYGVMHAVTVLATNPTDRRAKIEIVARAGGGVCRVLARIDGILCRTGTLGAGQEEVLHSYWLEPGQQRSNRMQLIPAAGSNLPHTIIVRSLVRN